MHNISMGTSGRNPPLEFMYSGFIRELLFPSVDVNQQIFPSFFGPQCSIYAVCCHCKSIRCVNRYIHTNSYSGVPFSNCRYSSRIIQE